MIGISLICVGRLKEEYLRAACAEYEKRMTTLCSLRIVEIAAQRLPENPSEREIRAALESEGKAILTAVPKGARIYSMCIEGSQRSSEELASEIAESAARGTGSFAFVIGGSYGLSDSVKAASSVRLSMSRMTFPHQVARMMLLEQLYRAMQINSGTKYHK